MAKPSGSHSIGDSQVLFVDAAQGDFHLAPLSPCVGAGNLSSSVLAEFDLDGRPRVIGTGLDLGAYESLCGGLLGTGEDFTLETLINFGGDPAACFKEVSVGSTLTIAFSSSGGGFWGDVHLATGQLFDETVVPLGAFPGLPDILVPAGFLFYDGLIPTTLGLSLLGPGGVSQTYLVPSFVDGLRFRVQAIVLSGDAANGINATSDAHEILFR